MKRRSRRPKLFMVTREERTLVRFYVEATSGLKARQTQTPPTARRTHITETVGEAIEVYSLPGGEQAIANSSVDGEYSRPRRNWPIDGVETNDPWPSARNDQ